MSARKRATFHSDDWAGCDNPYNSRIEIFIASSSITQFFGISVPLHCLHPLKSEPLKSRTHPCFFLFGSKLVYMLTGSRNHGENGDAIDRAKMIFLFIEQFLKGTEK